MSKFVSIKAFNCADRITTDLLVNISQIVMVDVDRKVLSTTEAENNYYCVDKESMPILINAIRGEQQCPIK